MALCFAAATIQATWEARMAATAYTLPGWLLSNARAPWPSANEPVARLSRAARKPAGLRARCRRCRLRTWPCFCFQSQTHPHAHTRRPRWVEINGSIHHWLASCVGAIKQITNELSENETHCVQKTTRNQLDHPQEVYLKLFEVFR